MADDHRSTPVKPGLLRRARARVIAAALALSALLAWYEPVREQGQVFLCDVAELIDQDDRFYSCLQLSEDVWATIERLQGQEESLSPEQSELLDKLRAQALDRAFKALSYKIGYEPVGPHEAIGVALDAEQVTRQAIQDTLEKGDPEELRALAMIAEGDIQNGLDLLEEQATSATSVASDKWRRVGELASNVDIDRALAAFTEASRLEPNDFETWLRIGQLERLADDLKAAESAFIKAMALAETQATESEYGAALVELGAVLRAQGDLQAPLEHFQAALEIAERLVEEDSGDTELQRGLFVVQTNLGELQWARADFSAALTSYRAAMSAVQRLSEVEPENSKHRRDLVLTHARIGSVHLARQDTPAALESYRDSLKIADGLAEQEPNNPGWQYSRMVAHYSLGVARQAQGEALLALKSYQAALEIADLLVDQDPNNAEWQSALSQIHAGFGTVQLQQDEASAALESYRAALAVADRAGELGFQSPQWQYLQSVYHQRIGDARYRLGEHAEALQAYEAALSDAVQLAASGPNNVEWQLNLMRANGRIAELRDFRGPLGNIEEARHHYRTALAIAASLQERLKLPRAEQEMAQRYSRRLTAMPID